MTRIPERQQPKKVSVNSVHRATAMLMLASPPIPKGQRHVDAVWPIPVATTVKTASTKDMARFFRALMEFNPQTMEDIPEIAKIYRRIGSEVEVALNWAAVIAEGVSSATHWALSTGDGMRAINIALEFTLKPGDEIIASGPLYGCTDNYLSHTAIERRGYKVRTVDLTDPYAILEVLSPQTKIIYFETETNPNLRVYDLRTISRLAKGQNPNVLVVVDNTFPSPAGCNPLKHGADIVVHSETKAIGGFSQEMGGKIILSKTLWPQAFFFRKDTGGVPAPQQIHALLTRGLPTLYDRFAAMQKNAQQAAAYLASSPHIQTTIYPGLESYQFSANAKTLLTDWDGNFAPGFMIAFIPAGKTEKARVTKAKQTLDYIARYGGSVIKHAVSLGGIGSLIEMPFLGTHATVSAEEKARWGVDGGMVRLSVGLGHYGDQVALLESAINHAYGH